jgi:hypothetical protein
MLLSPLKIPDTLRKQAKLLVMTAPSLRSSGACPPSKGRPGISVPRWTSAVRSCPTSLAADRARPVLFAEYFAVRNVAWAAHPYFAFDHDARAEGDVAVDLQLAAAAQ